MGSSHYFGFGNGGIGIGRSGKMAVAGLGAWAAWFSPSRRHPMVKTYLVDLGGTDIRFTPEGKVAVIDAIEALCAVSDPEDIWRELVAAHPEIVALCERYAFGDAPPAIVVDAPGWAVIEALLPEHVPCEA